MSYILLMIMTFSAHASTLDDRAQMLLNAKDPKALKMKINSLNGLKKTEVACEFELSSDQIPKSCYRLKLPKDKMEIVDQACERASIKMKESVEIKGLSKSCADFVNKKNKDIQYSQSEENPGEFLR